jgi:voltage-gated potassium channel
VITGTVAAFFSQNQRTLPPEARHVQETLNRYPELTTKEMDDMIASLEKWKERYKKEEDQSS